MSSRCISSGNGGREGVRTLCASLQHDKGSRGGAVDGGEGGVLVQDHNIGGVAVQVGSLQPALGVGGVAGGALAGGDLGGAGDVDGHSPGIHGGDVALNGHQVHAQEGQHTGGVVGDLDGCIGAGSTAEGPGAGVVHAQQGGDVGLRAKHLRVADDSSQYHLQLIAASVRSAIKSILS